MGVAPGIIQVMTILVAVTGGAMRPDTHRCGSPLQKVPLAIQALKPLLQLQLILPRHLGWLKKTHTKMLI